MLYSNLVRFSDMRVLSGMPETRLGGSSQLRWYPILDFFDVYTVSGDFILGSSLHSNSFRKEFSHGGIFRSLNRNRRHENSQTLLVQNAIVVEVALSTTIWFYVWLHRHVTRGCTASLDAALHCRNGSAGRPRRLRASRAN
jgi:hypothetical protein